MATKTAIERLRENHEAFTSAEGAKMAREIETARQKARIAAQLATVDDAAELAAAKLDAEIRAGLPEKRAISTFLGKAAAADTARKMGRSVNGEVLPPPEAPKAAEGTTPAVSA